CTGRAPANRHAAPPEALRRGGVVAQVEVDRAPPPRRHPVEHDPLAVPLDLDPRPEREARLLEIGRDRESAKAGAKTFARSGEVWLRVGLSFQRVEGRRIHLQLVHALRSLRRPRRRRLPRLNEGLARAPAHQQDEREPEPPLSKSTHVRQNAPGRAPSTIPTSRALALDCRAMSHARVAALALLAALAFACGSDPYEG